MEEYKILEGFSDFTKKLHEHLKEGWTMWGQHQAVYNPSGTKHCILLYKTGTPLHKPE